jgi:hypothetical protein
VQAIPLRDLKKTKGDKQLLKLQVCMYAYVRVAFSWVCSFYAYTILFVLRIDVPVYFVLL